MKASIIYNSHHGTTKAYAAEIARFLKEKGIESEVASINEYDKEYLDKSDLVLLGCWTSGLMIFAQHPEKAWKDFAKNLPPIQNKKLGLFTTYKLATGSMFKKMENCLSSKADSNQLRLRAKSSKLTDLNKKELTEFIR